MPPKKASSVKPVCKKTKWRPEEDKELIRGVETFGMGKWTMIVTLLPGRSPKQCRERYIGHLDPSLIHKEWTPEEDQHLLSLHTSFGNSWSKISHFIKGRSPNDAKNRFRYLAKVGAAYRKPVEIQSYVPQTTFDSSQIQSPISEQTIISEPDFDIFQFESDEEEWI